MGNFGLNKETAGAIFWGILPALAWLFFWIRSEDKKDREPFSLIIMVFLIGMLSVAIAVPLEHAVVPYIKDQTTLTITWAAIEELVKYLAIIIMIKGISEVNDPIDYAMYFIAGALGFAGLENIMFLMNPDVVANTSLKLMTGNLRYLGSTLLHAVSTGIIGIGLGLSYYQNWKNKFSYLLGGLLAAVALHGLFNLFIMNSSDQNFFRIFGILWVVSIISILLLEKLRRLKGQIVN